MGYKIDNEARTIESKKDCLTCKVKPACRFHSKMKELCMSNEFLVMNIFLETNNAMRVFEEHAKCQYYNPQYIQSPGDFVTAESDPKLIRDLMRHILKGGYSFPSALKGDSLITLKEGDPISLHDFLITANYLFI